MEKNTLKLTICGARGSMPCHGEAYREFGGATSCYLVRYNNRAVVVDCGSGTCRLPELLQGVQFVDILITHYHYDHIIGMLALPPLYRERGIRIFAPQCGGRHAYELLADFSSRPYWPVGVLDNIEVHDSIAENREELGRNIVFTSHPANHPDGGMLYRLDIAGRSVTFLFDNEETDGATVDFAAGSDILIYDSAFAPQELAQHRGWGHSSYAAGAQFARECGAKRLICTHHSPMRDDAELRDMQREAAALFEGAVFAREGDEYTI